ncbi:DeoR family transcriptional regulator [Xanthomonas melonis]|uniref:DeoR family transcriptional regulator n=1 Tax=Xanthomonas melonis TaxID=56456 RepID=A0A2S7DJX2_9XANT|nr:MULTISPECIES: DeoR family transcriptional regulator [Xanthomonas]MCC4585758.1 DeoR family transcriptional regulator [Xanthomonas sp. NCPPB 1067]MCC4599122.1 DeoR family transcriptional regulator [Xanthomonas melonis]MCD0245853.1 DeoR family transcriptional regulator [Xanthomonas melonis]MCD0257979.1 DeoR family transcriptional regulator [Xanthomonas melonis]MCD0266235.1 DeoR family transcriptional regulator [Xanthomonas melonis]
MRDHLRMESTHYRTVPAPALNPRQEQLVALVRQQGFADVEGLATRFEVTPQTIRRDLTLLCDAGVLRRYHGGVSMPSSVENLAYTARKALQAQEKRHIAAQVARFIPDDASLFINLGTTNEEVARALLQHRGLRVITNNLNVAVMLSANPSFEVIVAGGVVRGRDQGVTGEATVELIRQFKVDFGVIGISGIDRDGTLLDFDYQEVRVAQAIIEHSRQVVLAADHSKLGRNAMVRLGALAQVHDWFTDRPLPQELAPVLAEAGTRVHVTGTDTR